jgi:inner membrane protein
MDSITHIVLGACAGEAIAGKEIGKKAMLMGALAQSIPDVDFVASFWLEGADDLLAHRGITHSFLFVLLVSPILALVSRRTIRPLMTPGKWMLLFAVEMLIHLFLDAFNNYGVGWLEPFSDARISFNTIYVADPLLTIWPLIACAVLVIMRGRVAGRKKWWATALVMSSVYLAVCIANKIHVDSEVRRAIKQQSVEYETYFTTPAPLQSFLWMVVAGTSEGYHVGYRSVFDSSPNISFQYFPVNEHLLTSIEHHEEVEKLKKFSRGFYTVEQWSDTVVFNDLRFGQVVGWHNPKQKFVFHYFLKHGADNTLVVQRGRFAHWNSDAARSFFRRIVGN